MNVKLKLERAFRYLAIDVGLDPNSVQYCLARIRKEGVQFLTVTLPQLSKAVLRSLELGYFSRPTCFAWKGRSLRFFRSLLDGIFDSDGIVRSDVDVVSLWGLRQLCEYMYKLAFTFTADKQRAACSNYRSLEQSLLGLSFDRVWVESLRKNFETYYPEASRLTVSDIFAANRPRHGPGSFAGSHLWDIPYYVWKLLPSAFTGTTTRMFKPFSGFFRAYPSDPERITLAEDEDPTCDVLFVPKDSRGPRVISKEPPHLLRAQLSYFDTLSSTLERITSGRINFRDQTVNQQLAIAASIDKRMATLDLKDASDRVTLRLVAGIFRHSPGLLRFVRNYRSTHARLPDGGRLPLYKLSGMGSGLTFPTMALVIHLSVCTYVSKRYAIPYKDCMRQVYVYGDDLIVPSEWYQDAISALGCSGLQVNRDKCFVNSNFRESCGADAFAGNRIEPVRLRLHNASLGSPEPVLNIGSSGILELERHCRELHQAGLLTLKEYYYSCLEHTLGNLPQIHGETPILGRYNNSIVDHRDERVTVWTVVPKKVKADVCPIKFLGRFLRSDSLPSWKDIFDADGPAVFGEVAIPRKIRLFSSQVSSIHLNGV